MEIGDIIITNFGNIILYKCTIDDQIYGYAMWCPSAKKLYTHFRFDGATFEMPCCESDDIIGMASPEQKNALKNAILNADNSESLWLIDEFFWEKN